MDEGITCKYATDTRRSWCNCPVTCTEIECRNQERLRAILPKGAGRTDAASYHTKYAPEDADYREGAKFVLVRSKYCCEAHCVDFSILGDAKRYEEDTRRASLF